MNTLLLTAVVVYTASASVILLGILMIWAGVVFNVKYFTNCFRGITYADLIKSCFIALIPIKNTIVVYEIIILFIDEFLDVEVRK